jgi:hypothetical protein
VLEPFFGQPNGLASYIDKIWHRFDYGLGFKFSESNEFNNRLTRPATGGK